MPPKQRDPTEGAEWLRRAHSNLARARAGRSAPEVLYEDLCFDAQQAAEKAIKALLVDRKVGFPKTHAIMDLLTILEHSGAAVPEEIRRAGLLTGYAVETRYPGLSEEVTKEGIMRRLLSSPNVLSGGRSRCSRPVEKNRGLEARLRRCSAAVGGDLTTAVFQASGMR